MWNAIQQEKRVIAKEEISIAFLIIILIRVVANYKNYFVKAINKIIDENKQYVYCTFQIINLFLQIWQICVWNIILRFEQYMPGFFQPDFKKSQGLFKIVLNKIYNKLNLQIEKMPG